MVKLIGFCLIAVALLVSTCGGADTTSTHPVAVVLISPEEGMTYTSTEIALVATTEGNTSNLNWSYRLNGVANVSFPSAGHATANGSARIKLTASEGVNTVDVYAEDLIGNTGKVTVSFIVNTTLPEFSGLSQEERGANTTKEIELTVEANAPIMNYQENCTVNVSLGGNETANESAKIRIEMGGDANVANVFVDDSTENVGDSALFFVTAPEGGMINGDEVQLEVHANDSLTNWSDWVNISNVFSFEGDGKVRLTVNASDLVVLFMGGGDGRAVNATISFIEGTSTSEQKLETVTTVSGLTVLPADVWKSRENDIVLEVNEDELLSVLRQWGQRHENCSYTGHGSMRLTANTSDLVDLFMGDGAEDNAKTTISVIIDTTPPEIQIKTDTSPPELMFISPEEGGTYATRAIKLEVKANEPISNWSYRLNEGGRMTLESGNGGACTTLAAGEGANNVTIYAVNSVGHTGTAELSFCVDTTPPEITVFVPEEGKTSAAREIQLEVKANEPISNWGYQLNGGDIVTLTPSGTGGETAITTLIAKPDTNIVEIFAEDSVGNTGKTEVSFVVMDAGIANELSVQGTGHLTITAGVERKTVSVGLEKRIVAVTGLGGNYSLDSVDIWGKSVDPSAPDYHHTSSTSFSGDNLRSTETYGSPASQGGIGATYTEVIDASKLQKNVTVSIKTIPAQGLKQSFEVETAAALSGKRVTHVELSTRTTQASHRQMIDGDCTGRMNLTVEE
ncbi:MAG: hypothetical protein U9R10_03815 [Euryarchaeota archaeon]|nr:hypothetical protein [Euryarchaeota archaeon]